MRSPVDLKSQALLLRTRGASLQEIASQLNIAKSTASIWLRGVSLSLEAKQRLINKEILGRKNAIKIKKEKAIQKKLITTEKAIAVLKTLSITPEIHKICCALMWWCEGNKNETFVRFTSSDPTLIQNFLFLFRSSFQLNEAKFRALVHLHTYHNETMQKEFWSKTTKIPVSQFYKSYQKTNTGIRKKENYAGCIAISYYDSQIAKELEAIYNAFTFLTIGGVR